MLQKHSWEKCPGCSDWLSDHTNPWNKWKSAKAIDICLIISIYSRFPIHFRWLNFCTKLAKPVKRLANRQTCELAWLGIRILLKSITKAPIPVGGESFWNAVLKYKDSTFREMFLAIQNILVFFIAEILVWTGMSSHTHPHTHTVQEEFFHWRNAIINSVLLRQHEKAINMTTICSTDCSSGQMSSVQVVILSAQILQKRKHSLSTVQVYTKLVYALGQRQKDGNHIGSLEPSYLYVIDPKLISREWDWQSVNEHNQEIYSLVLYCYLPSFFPPCLIL